jgi:serine/threonine protein kinase
LFRAVDTTDSADVVVKFPKPTLLSESGARSAFTRELLIGSRVNSPFVGGSIPIALERQTRLYGVQPFYDGQTLEQRMKSPIALAEALNIAVNLTRAVAALHRQGIIHRDIKPENVILPRDGGLKLVDLGVARLPASRILPETKFPAHPLIWPRKCLLVKPVASRAINSRWALHCGACSPASGPMVRPTFSRPRFREAAAPSRTRPELPGWLDAVLLRAVAIQPQDRFGDVVECCALEGGAAVERTPLRAPALIERHPVAFWKGVSAICSSL